jgi:hypothetical protein
MTRQTTLILAWSFLLAAWTTQSNASLTLLNTTGNCSHVNNLVTNGSFENVAANGPTGDGPANQILWATGTTLNFVPFDVPPGWSSSGNANSYAVWGNDAAGPPYILRGSDTLPDGTYGMYFGNGAHATVNLPPNFNADGSVTFSGTPTITQPASFPTPVELWQQIPTATIIAPKYCMSFWVSGEGVNVTSDQNGILMGIFGLQVTNVLAGDPVLYFAVPSAPDSPVGGSKQFEFEFVPLNTSQDVTVKFINYGHFDLTFWGRGPTTELVLDDVMINAVPEPSSISLIAFTVVAVAVFRGPRKRSAGLQRNANSVP